MDARCPSDVLPRAICLHDNALVTCLPLGCFPTDCDLERVVTFGRDERPIEQVASNYNGKMKIHRYPTLWDVHKVTRVSRLNVGLSPILSMIVS
jgi:hypothetical protein